MKTNSTPAAQSAFAVLDFQIYKSLKQCTDSMLYDTNTVIAYMKAKTSDGRTISVSLMVCGSVSVTYQGVTYHNPSEFPQELRELIASRFSDPPLDADMTDEALDAAMEAFDPFDQDQEDDYCITLNNWFEYIWGISDADGDDVAHDGILCEEELHAMTDDELRSEMEEVIRQVLELV